MNPPAPQDASEKPVLGYAPAPRKSAHQFLRRSLALFLFAAGAAFGWWHKPLIAHAQLLLWQRDCARHTFAPDVVIASVNPPAPATVVPIPAFWSLYESNCIPAPGSNRVTFNSSFTNTLVFLHHMQSPAGHERIVAIRCIAGYLPSASVAQAFQALVVEPAALWSLSSKPILHAGRFPGGYPTHVNVKVQGGQPDPADPAHFTIAYTVNDQPGIIDGRLADDDTVTLHIRDGSADVMRIRQKQPSASE